MNKKIPIHETIVSKGSSSINQQNKFRPYRLDTQNIHVPSVTSRVTRLSYVNFIDFPIPYKIWKKDLLNPGSPTCVVPKTHRPFSCLQLSSPKIFCLSPRVDLTFRFVCQGVLTSGIFRPVPTRLGCTALTLPAPTTRVSVQV